MSLPHREWTARRPRRTSAPSMMSSWTSVAVWMNSTTAAFSTARSPEYPPRRAAIKSTAGRTRLPPLFWMYFPISGIRATRDWMWRTNSCSTRSRSSRIGSKICARSEATGTLWAGSLNGMSPGVASPYQNSATPEKTDEIVAGPFGQLRRGLAAGRREGVQHARDVRRLIPFAAIRHRRQVRAVGLDQDPVARDDPRRLAQAVRFREADDTGERQVEAGVERPPRHRGIAREAVEHAANATALLEDRKGVVGRLAGMDDHRSVELAGQRQLRGKHVTLHVARREVVVVVEPDFADAACLEPGGVLPRDRCGIRDTPRERARRMRMHAGRKVHRVPPLAHH